MTELNKPINPSPVKSDMVKVRVVRGRLLMGREKVDGATSAEVYAEEGEIVDVKRSDVAHLLDRKFQGYPTDRNPVTGHCQVAKDPMPFAPFKGDVSDSPIELVAG